MSALVCCLDLLVFDLQLLSVGAVDGLPLPVLVLQLCPRIATRRALAVADVVRVAAAATATYVRYLIVLSE